MSAAQAPERERLLTIGMVCRRLQLEFPDISISKIRYLEDQGLLAPRRTQSGYRLFSDDDVERLETILRLQRDEFLPLRVIRQELASPSGAGKERRRRRAVGLADPDDELDLGELCERAAITPELARELEEYGLLQPRRAGNAKLYPAGDVDVAVACAKLSRFGISARHLSRPGGRLASAADRALATLAQPRAAGGGGAAAPDAGRAGPRAFPAALLARPQAARGELVRVEALKAKIRDVPDFPEPGIVFKDIMPLLADSPSLREAVDLLAEWAEPRRPDVILGAEARGFILGAALAYKLGCGFVAARRPGKLPWKTVSATYALEYGENSLELHADAIADGARVLVHDDVLATGGTARAICDLATQLGGEIVGVEFVIELAFLDGRKHLEGFDVHSLITY
jgi:adenine phosphoribosyltransferase